MEEEKKEVEKEEKIFQMPKIPDYHSFFTVHSILLLPSEPPPLCCLWAIEGLLIVGNLINQTGGPRSNRAGSLQLVKGSCLLLGKSLSHLPELFAFCSSQGREGRAG